MKINNTIFLISMLFLVQCEKKTSPEKSIINKEKSALINSNRYLSPQELKGKNFDGFYEKYAVANSPQKYFPSELENFIMGDDDSWLAGIRAGLLEVHSSEEIEKRDILIKEVTWEISPTQNLTIWYERKNRKWVPIQDYIWDKGADF